MTSFGYARASTVFKSAHLSRPIITPRSKDVWRCITNVGLRKSRHESRGSSGICQGSLFEKVGADTLVVTCYVSIILQHGSTMHLG
jgi:hypothetical protein